MRTSEDRLKEMMIAAQDGDAGAYKALLTALAPALRSFFSRRLHGAVEDVEDLVQEALIAIHTRRTTYDRARPFTAWLYAVARYKLVDYLRRMRRDIPIEGLEDMLVAEGFEEASASRMDIDKLLGGLPNKQARAIRATKIDGLSVAEAARNGALSEADVKISVHRGLKALAALVRGR